MKVSIEYTPAQVSSAYHMEIGQVGRIINPGKQAQTLNTRGGCDYNGEIVLRTYNGIVSLTNPHNTWENGSIERSRKDVQILPIGTRITLELTA